MKNVLLSILLGGLLTFTYYYEEIGKNNKLTKINEAAMTIKVDFNSIKKVEFSNAVIAKEDGNWKIEKLSYPADNLLMKKIIELLKGISTVRELNTEKKDIEQFFSANKLKLNIHDKNGEADYFIGDVSALDGYFYVAETVKGMTRYYQAFDKNHLDIAYKNDLDLNLKKYLRIKELLIKSQMFFIKKGLFTANDFKLTTNIIIKNLNTEEFMIDLSGNKTFPDVPSGLEYRPQLKNNVINYFTSLRIVKIMNASTSQLSELVSTIKIKSHKKQQLLKLFSVLNGARGKFLKFSNKPDWVFEVDKKTSKLFYLENQNLWNLSIFSQKKLSTLKSIEFTMGSPKNSNTYNFSVDDIKKFKINSSNSSVTNINIENFNLLFHIIFGLQNFGSNQVISFKKLKKPSDIIITILGKKLGVIFDQFEITLVNYSDKYTIHHQFELSDRQIRGLEDFFDFNN